MDKGYAFCTLGGRASLGGRTYRFGKTEIIAQWEFWAQWNHFGLGVIRWISSLPFCKLREVFSTTISASSWDQVKDSPQKSFFSESLNMAKFFSEEKKVTLHIVGLPRSSKPLQDWIMYILILAMLWFWLRLTAMRSLQIFTWNIQEKSKSQQRSATHLKSLLKQLKKLEISSLIIVQYKLPIPVELCKKLIWVLPRILDSTYPKCKVIF